MNWHHTNLPAAIQDELTQLAQHYGPPIVWQIALVSQSGLFAPRIKERAMLTSGRFAPLGKPDRYGEVCMVIRRRDRTLVTARKEFYPPTAFRLLTGGINHGEAVLDALLRETAEETGLEVQVQRFLAAISYRPEQSDWPDFHTFAFLVDETGGTFGPTDPDERVAEFRFITSADLPHLAATLEQLGNDYDDEIEGRWSDWGRFRAVIHRAVAETLA